MIIENWCHTKRNNEIILATDSGVNTTNREAQGGVIIKDNQKEVQIKFKLPNIHLNSKTDA